MRSAARFQYATTCISLKKDLVKFAGVCRVVNGLRHCRIGQIGTRPLGFNTCRASEKLLQKYGITVVPADLSEVIFAAQKLALDDPRVLAKLEEVKAYAHIPESYQDKLANQVRFGVAVEDWIAANDVDAVALQCWDSLEKNYKCAPCITMAMLGDRLIPSACETDVAGAVSMYALTLAAGTPSALADWNNNFAEDRNMCVCTHCGNFPKSFSKASVELGPLGVLGRTLGKVDTFGAVFSKVAAGDFTFFRISTDDARGVIKAYTGEGDITNDPYDMNGCIAVTRVNNLQKLMKHICRNGFEHHVGLVRGHVADILEEAVGNYLGWDLYVHE